jgi:hypothetical protein
MTGVRFTDREGTFLNSAASRVAVGSTGCQGSFPGSKGTELSPPSGAEFKNGEAVRLHYVALH